MNTRAWGWSLLIWLCVPLLARAQLIIFPDLTYISVPGSAVVGETVTIDVTAETGYSDNSDGKDWNSGDQVTIYRIIIDYLPPGGNWTNLSDFLSPHLNPSSVSVPLTLNTPGPWLVRIKAADGRPWLSNDNQFLTYSIAVNPPPGPVITSSLSDIVNQGQFVWYPITADNNPTSFSASNLPAGLTYDATTGEISGFVSASGTISSTISATNAYGTDTKTLTWSITAASIVPNGAVNPNPSYVDSTILFTRDGSANFEVAWTQNFITRPDGTVYDMGALPLGTTSWMPDGGAGTYTWQYRVYDDYNNFQEQLISFTLTIPAVSAPTGVASTTTGSTFVTLSWNDASAQAGIDHYNVYRDGSFIGSTSSTSYTDSTVNFLAAYTYTVYAVDTQGHVSDVSANLSITTLRPLEVFTPL